MTMTEFANLQEAFIGAAGHVLELVLAVYLVLVSLIAVMRLFPWQRIISRVSLNR